MAYHLIDEEQYEVPDFVRQMRLYKRRNGWGEISTDETEGSTKEPNGRIITTTFKTWRCGHCRALFIGGFPPKECGKCHCR